MIARVSAWTRRLKRGLSMGLQGRQSVRTTVGEITPCIPRPVPGDRPRLNLLLPSINAAHYFGGIHTAVLLYRELCVHFPRSRIVLIDSAPDAEAVDRFSDHTLAACHEDATAERQLVPFNDRYGRSLPVERGDLWLTTAWWTAYAAQRIASWQGDEYGREGAIACLIQDFEPGFYAWSSQSALALSTYRPERDCAVFNTRLLADYFAAQDLRYRRAWTFEPTLNHGLRAAMAKAHHTPRARRIVIYGRPSTPRNAFELICEALRQWGWSDARSAQWEVVAPGELIEDVDLGPLRVRALGKLDIDRYADLLSTSAIGLSLMVSPHPSYPPLEMAAFGMRVLTNRFANKDLADFSTNITSVDFAPEAIAGALATACDECEERGMAPLTTFVPEHPFLGAGNFGSLARELASALQFRPEGGRCMDRLKSI